MRKMILLIIITLATVSAMVMPACAANATFSHKSMMRMLKANKIEVAASTLQVANLVKAIGGDKVVVSVLSKNQDPAKAPEAYHSVVQALKDAKVLFHSGNTWVNDLVQKSGNSRIASGTCANISIDSTCSVEEMAGRVAAGLIAASPENRDYYLKNLDEFKVEK